MLLLPRSACPELLEALDIMIVYLGERQYRWANPIHMRTMGVKIEWLRDQLIAAQVPPTEREQAFYDAAYREYHEEGKLELEEDVTVSDLREADEGDAAEGAYVLAWVFVNSSLALAPEALLQEREQRLAARARALGVTAVHLALALGLDPDRVVAGTLEEVIHTCLVAGDDPVTLFEVIEERGEKLRGAREGAA